MTPPLYIVWGSCPAYAVARRRKLGWPRARTLHLCGDVEREARLLLAAHLDRPNARPIVADVELPAGLRRILPPSTRTATA